MKHEHLSEEDFRFRIKMLREQLGYTMAELARKAKIKNQAMIQRYEDGNALPTLRQFILLSEGLETTPNDLLLKNPRPANARDLSADELKIIEELRNITACFHDETTRLEAIRTILDHMTNIKNMVRRSTCEKKTRSSTSK